MKTINYLRGEEMLKATVGGKPLYRIAYSVRCFYPTKEQEKLMRDHPEKCPSAWFSYNKGE